MIFPQEKDIGRSVVYKHKDGREEVGVIDSFNDYFVWVIFGPCDERNIRRQDLEWQEKRIR